MSGRLRVVSGRTVLLGLSAWSRTAFGVRLGLRDVAREFTSADVDAEVREALGPQAANRNVSSNSGLTWRWRETGSELIAEDVPRAEELMDLLFGLGG